jgi:hypothetical protein
MDAEILAAYQLDCEQRGVRFQRNGFEHWRATYNALRKHQAIGGDGSVSTRQLARDLYPDVGDDLEAWRRKRYSIVRWLAGLQRQGLISKQELRSERGKSLGLRVELQPIPEKVAMMAASRGCSSVG